MTKSPKHPFAHVDEQADPRSWVAVLDQLRADPRYAAYKKRLFELLEPQRDGRYLEIGTGTGADALDFAATYGVRIVGVDSSRTMIAEARRRELKDAVMADAHALPFEAASFDGAWADRTAAHRRQALDRRHAWSQVRSVPSQDPTAIS